MIAQIDERPPKMTAALTAETRPAAAEYDPDPREVLDLQKRSEVAVAIKSGASRRMAAGMVGCHHATIARTAERDPAFAKQLQDAESGVDLGALKRIQEASAENKNWRAAAWVLERRHPEEFGRKTPHTFTGDQVVALLAQIFNFTLPTVRKDKVNGFMREFNEALRDVESQIRRADRWRNMAEADESNPRRNGKPLRSPYEHREWFDPNRREMLAADVNQAWLPCPTATCRRKKCTRPPGPTWNGWPRSPAVSSLLSTVYNVSSRRRSRCEKASAVRRSPGNRSRQNRAEWSAPARIVTGERQFAVLTPGSEAHILDYGKDVSRRPRGSLHLHRNGKQ
jgi:hypothetical protein